MWRLVICLDVEADTLEEAYSGVYDKMKTIDTEDFQWGSSDEAYDPEGGVINPEVMQAARMAKFSTEKQEDDGH